MRISRFVSLFVLTLLAGLISSLVWAETIELVTYYPAPVTGGQDPQVRSFRVGTAYQNLPVPNDGVALIADALAIGVPVPTDGTTITPLGVFQVVGGANLADKVVFMPGTGGTLKVGIGTTTPNEQLELTGNLRLPATTATAGIIRSGADTYIHSFGTNNFFAGVNAGNLTVTGESNTGVGAGALPADTTGSNNTAIGYQVLYFNTTGQSNIATGGRVLYSNTTGSYNTGAGYNTLYSNTTGSENTATGLNALGSNTIGNQNTATGLQSLYTNTSGSYNTATGYQALYYSTSDSNTATGYKALYSNTTGTSNTATGSQALQNNTGGSLNVAIGYQTLYGSYYSINNTGIGYQALYNNNGGSNNTAIGYQALYGSTNANVGPYINFGNNNTAIGYQALYSNICYGYSNAGDNNTAIGQGAGSSNTTGSNNTFIGYNAGPTSGGLTNATAIGNGAQVSANNALVLGSGASVGIGTTAPAYKLDVAGQAHASSFPTSSDLRFKTHVTELTHVLDRLDGIRGVSFDWNERYQSLGRSTGHREIGLIAQEVERKFPELVTTWGEEHFRAIDYGRFSAVLLEATKELKAENEVLKQQMGMDRQRIITLEKALQSKK